MLLSLRMTTTMSRRWFRRWRRVGTPPGGDVPTGEHILFASFTSESLGAGPDVLHRQAGVTQFPKDFSLGEGDEGDPRPVRCGWLD
jgi:hypothetical protein